MSNDITPTTKELPKENTNLPKSKTIYGIETTDDESGKTSVKAYCSTYDIALRESEKYHNWRCPTPVGKKVLYQLKLLLNDIL